MVSVSSCVWHTLYSCAHIPTPGGYSQVVCDGRSAQVSVLYITLVLPQHHDLTTGRLRDLGHVSSPCACVHVTVMVQYSHCLT